MSFEQDTSTPSAKTKRPLSPDEAAGLSPDHKTRRASSTTPALTHPVIEHPRFQECFKGIYVRQTGLSRPEVRVVGTCVTCGATDNHANRGASLHKIGAPLREFHVLEHVGRATANLIRKHATCFNPPLVYEELKASVQSQPLDNEKV